MQLRIHYFLKPQFKTNYSTAMENKKEVKTEVTEWNDDKFGLDLEIIKNEELVAKLCTEELDLKDELDDVPINEHDEVQLTGNICEDRHSEFPEIDVSPLNGGSYNSNSQYLKRKSSVQETSTDEKYFRGLSNKVTQAVNETQQSFENVTDHTDQQQPFKCRNCKFSASFKHDLISHMQIHKKHFDCQFCNYRTYHKSHLVQHIRTHTGEKPYACDICSYKYANKSSLAHHIMRVHTGENVVCDICGFKCIEKSSLTRHIRIHTGDKPYACDVCGYKCIEKSRLTNHIRIHTGEKPYACDICSYKYANKSSLAHHIRRKSCL